MVPNEFLDDVLPNLDDTELRVLLVVNRQTLGWIEDEDKYTRKAFDWISRGQMERKTGRKSTAIRKAINHLTEMDLIVVLDQDGNELRTPQARQRAGQQRKRLYYGLNLSGPWVKEVTRRGIYEYERY